MSDPFSNTPNHSVIKLEHGPDCERCQHTILGALAILEASPHRPRTFHVTSWPDGEVHKAYVRRELPAPWKPSTSALAIKLRATEPPEDMKPLQSPEGAALMRATLDIAKCIQSRPIIATSTPAPPAPHVHVELYTPQQDGQ